jgi:Phytanoyl-CoA dioxygenase (PhyH)
MRDKHIGVNLMITYARLAPGPGWQPVRALLYYLQRIAVEPHCRRAVTASIASCIRAFHRGDGKMPPEEIFTALTNDGCAMLPQLLSDGALAEMMAYLERAPVELRGGRTVAANEVPRGEALANFSLTTVINCPHMVELANHPMLLQLATAYLGCAPTISSIGLRWSYPAPTDSENVQNFHRDPDDWRFIKFFAYLTDVDETSGPHVFIRGSHRTAGQLFQQRHNESDIVRRFGAQSVMSVVGPRGTMFVADTAGIHKGAVPSARPRLLLEVGYSILPVFAFDYQPERMDLPSPPRDRYVNRLILAQ